MTPMYNLFLEYIENLDLLYEKIRSYVDVGYNGFCIVFKKINDPNKILKDLIKKYEKDDVKIYSRFHINEESIKLTNVSVSKRNIFKLLNKARKKNFTLVTIDSNYLNMFNPNEIIKFNLVTITSGVSLYTLSKLIKKPIMFEFIFDEKSLNLFPSFKEIRVLKILLKHNKLIVSTPLYPFTPLQISAAIYGLASIKNFSYNVVSTLPLKVIESSGD